MLKRTTTFLALLAATAMMLPSAHSAFADAPIQVTLNGTSIHFANTPPMQVHGSTLVPMRDIFEALGATVRFDKASQTVYGQKGDTAIILPLGALTATVNGQPHTLPQPAQLINGTTLVPLRFISEALGAAVAWNPATSTVTIQTGDEQAGGSGTGPVTGQVTQINTGVTPPQLTLSAGGQAVAVPISSSTIILRSATGKPGIQVPLSELTPGDQVMVQRDSDGYATSVTATFGEARGTIIGIGMLTDGNYAVTLSNNRVIEVSPNAPVTFAGRTVSVSDLKANDRVVIRTNPASNVGFGVTVASAVNPNPPLVGPTNPLPPGATSVSVDSFTQDATKPLKAGDVLSATLTGTPGGKASFAIPGVAEDIPMRETSPGVYQGTFTVPRDASVTRASVLGKLVAGGVSSPLIQAPGTLTIAGRPPKIADFGPARGSTVESNHPLIYAQFTDTGVGINPDRTRITLDGRDVTGDAQITPSLFTYKPANALASGPHTVVVTVTDRAGNTATTNWTFEVSTSKVIQSFTTNEPTNRAVGPGATVVFTLNAHPGGRATASVGSLARDIPLRETDPGVYVGEYTVKAGDSIDNAPVTAHFTTRDGTAVTTSLAAGLTIAAGPPPAPKITSPADGDTVSTATPLTVRGRAVPGSTVRVTVNYESKVLGGFLPVTGSSGSKDVVADKRGEWVADGLSLQIRSLFGSGRDTVFTITATELDAGGNVASDATSIKVKPG